MVCNALKTRTKEAVFKIISLKTEFFHSLTVSGLAKVGFSALKFIRSKKLSATKKLSAEHETPPIANVLLEAAFICCHWNSEKYLCLVALFFKILVNTFSVKVTNS